MSVELTNNFGKVIGVEANFRVIILPKLDLALLEPFNENSKR